MIHQSVLQVLSTNHDTAILANQGTPIINQSGHLSYQPIMAQYQPAYQDTPNLGAAILPLF